MYYFREKLTKTAANIFNSKNSISILSCNMSLFLFLFYTLFLFRETPKEKELTKIEKK